MALCSVSLTWVPPANPSKMMMVMSSCSPNSINSSPSYNNMVSCSNNHTSSSEEKCFDRRSLLLSAGILAVNFIPSTSASAQEVPANYSEFVDKEDGYSYVYPSDWRDFDLMAHDSAFKDRYLQLQNVRVSFIPTDKNDLHDLGPMEDVVQNLVNNIYAAPNQLAFIKGMEERSSDGKNYYTFEYQLSSPNFSVTRFTTLAIANGRCYTLTVSANERRWRRFRDQLKVVADSFKVFEI